MELSKDVIEKIIREVIAEEQNKNTEPPRHIDKKSGVISIDPTGMKLDKFPFPIDGERVWLKDIITLEESPRLGCGIMELEDTSFEWTLTYDEVDYIMEGTLDILLDDRKVTATAGQIIFIPKDTKIRFSTPNKTRFMYVCYPANWAD